MARDAETVRITGKATARIEIRGKDGQECGIVFSIGN
jgi:hypothetical protein